MKKITFTLGLILFVFVLFAQKAEFRTKTVSIFKNGTAFFQKEITENTDSENSIITKLPIADSDAMFGTIWFNAPSNEIYKIGSFPDSVKTEHSADNILSMLKANKGKALTLNIKGFEKPVTGEILKVDNNFLMIKTKDSWITTVPLKVEYITFSQEPKTTYYEQKVKELIKIVLKKKSKKQKVELMYMQKGLTWTPNYYIRIIGENKAELTLRANVMNDIEEIKNTDINFVVGVPSFSFSNIESPITSNEGVDDFIAALNGRRKYGSYTFDNRLSNMSNAITTQQAITRNDPNYNNTSDSELTGKGSTDEGLYFYKKEKASLRKGERAFFELLKADIEYEQIYSVDLEENTNIYNRYTYGNTNSENKVWHSIRFKNNTESPFTTGAAFIMRKEGDNYKPVSQNYLYYTPSGVKTTVKTTISPDISVTTNEKEIDRREKALKYHDLITIEAEINVENYKNKDIKLEIKRLVTGEIISSNVECEKISKLKSWDSKNKQNDTRWDIELKANEKKTIKYKYKIYVAR